MPPFDARRRAAQTLRAGRGQAERLLAAGRTNAAAARLFAAARRRDHRFGLLPWDAWQAANVAALVLTALAVLAIVLDPWLIAWHGTLSPALRGLFRWLTELGRGNWILFLSGLYFLLSLARDAAALGPRLRARRAVRAAAALYVFLAVALAGALAVTAKYLFGRARPNVFAETGPYAFDIVSFDARWASFPSGHAATAMALATALAMLFPRARFVFLCAGFWVAVSRLVTRAHYPSDVLAGCLLGALLAWLLSRAFARRRLVFGFDAAGRVARRQGASGRLT